MIFLLIWEFIIDSKNIQYHHNRCNCIIETENRIDETEKENYSFRRHTRRYDSFDSKENNEEKEKSYDNTVYDDCSSVYWSTGVY